MTGACDANKPLDITEKRNRAYLKIIINRPKKKWRRPVFTSVIPQTECDSYNNSVSTDYKEIVILFGDYSIHIKI